MEKITNDPNYPWLPYQHLKQTSFKRRPRLTQTWFFLIQKWWKPKPPKKLTTRRLSLHRQASAKNLRKSCKEPSWHRNSSPRGLPWILNFHSLCYLTKKSCRSWRSASRQWTKEPRLHLLLACRKVFKFRLHGSPLGLDFRCQDCSLLDLRRSPRLSLFVVRFFNGSGFHQFWMRKIQMRWVCVRRWWDSSDRLWTFPFATMS